MTPAANTTPGTPGQTEIETLVQKWGGDLLAMVAEETYVAVLDSQLYSNWTPEERLAAYDLRKVLPLIFNPTEEE